MNYIKGMDLNLLVVLDSLLRQRSVSKAAKSLGVSQPAVSAALARLRLHLKDPLFVRSSHGIEPTRRAELLQPRLRQALAELTAAVFKPSAFVPEECEQRLRISIDDYIGQALAPELIARLEQAAPKMQIEFLLAPTLGVARELAAGDFDLAIRIAGNEGAGIYQRKIIDETFTCLARQGHPHIRKNLTLKLFTEQRHLLVSPYGGFSGFVDKALAEHGLTRRVMTVVPHFATVPWVLMQSDALVTLPTRIAEKYAAHLPVVKFSPPVAIPGFSMYLLWHERVHLDPAVKWLREQLFLLK